MKKLLLVLFIVFILVSCNIFYINEGDVLFVTKIDTSVTGAKLTLERFPNEYGEGNIIIFYSGNNDYKIGDKFKLVKVEGEK